MPSSVEDLLSEASSKIKAEADRLRETINEKEAKFREETDPLREQLRELDAAIARIEGKPEPKANGSRQRAPRGQNRDAILDYVKKNPGASASAISEATGITRTTVYATAGKLVQEGTLTKGDEEGGVGYRLP